MRFYGYGGYGSWEDTLVSIESLVPSWFAPDILHIDVGEGVEGVTQLREIATTIDPSKNVVLSDRAQKALIKIMQEDYSRLSDIFQRSAEMPSEAGERVRAAVVARQQEIEGRLGVLKRASVDAVRLGIPEVMSSGEVQRTEIAIGALVLLGIAIVAALAVVGWIVTEAIKSDDDTSTLEELITTLAAAGEWDTMAEIFSGLGPKTKPFPWGWLIGIGVSAVSIGLLWTYASGYARAKGKYMAERK